MPRRLTFSLIVDYFVYLLVVLVENVLNIIPESWARAFGTISRTNWLASISRS